MLWIIPGVYFVFVTAEFAAVTFVSLQLTAQGRSALLVGLFAAALWAGILLASSAAHAVVGRFGHARAFVGGTALSCLALAAFPLLSAYAALVGGAFALGLGGGIVWVAGESWLAEAAPVARRGFYVGLFETSVGLGLMAGPALVPLSAWLGGSTLWLSAALMAGALLLATRLLGAVPPDRVVEADAAARAAGTERATNSAWLRPVIGIALFSGMMESGVSALLPSISMRSGFSLEAAAWLGTVIGAGSALLQPPAGMLADRLGTRRIALLCWAVVLATTMVLLALSERPAAILWVAGFLLGGVGGAVFTLLIVDLGHRLEGTALVRALAWLVAGYSVGTSLGPVMGGWLFDVAGLRGTALLLVSLAVAGGALTLSTGDAATSSRTARP